MTVENGFDRDAAHRFFSAQCFNATWDLFDKSPRSFEDETTMLLCSAASLWHWTQRPDCTPKSLSIGCWQLSRAYSLIGEGSLAKRFAEQCLSYSEHEEPFYLGYAHEALARAALTAGNSDEAHSQLNKATAFLPSIADETFRQQLIADLDEINSHLLKLAQNAT